MKRWTMAELALPNATRQLIVEALYERRTHCTNVYAPLYGALTRAITEVTLLPEGVFPKEKKEKKARKK